MSQTSPDVAVFLLSNILSYPFCDVLILFLTVECWFVAFINSLCKILSILFLVVGRVERYVVFIVQCCFCMSHCLD